MWPRAYCSNGSVAHWMVRDSDPSWLNRPPPMKRDLIVYWQHEPRGRLIKTLPGHACFHSENDHNPSETPQLGQRGRDTIPAQWSSLTLLRGVPVSPVYTWSPGDGQPGRYWPGGVARNSVLKPGVERDCISLVISRGTPAPLRLQIQCALDISRSFLVTTNERHSIARP